MSTFLQADQVTTVLPDPISGNVGRTESQIQLKRKSMGATVRYTKPSDRVTISQTWDITRSKHAELKQFVDIYHRIDWRIEFGHDGSIWSAKLIGEPITGTTTGRGSKDNEDSVTITITFSALRLN